MEGAILENEDINASRKDIHSRYRFLLMEVRFPSH